MADLKSFPAGQFQFSLDGAPDAGYVKSVSGGYIKGEVAAEQAGPDFHQFKHVATVDTEPLVVELGMGLSKPMIHWIADSWRRQYSRRNGHVGHGDFDRWSQLEQHFTDALLIETAFPALDASSKEPLYMTAKILPEVLEVKKGSARLGGIITPKQKLWMSCNFALSIDGVDCKGVNKIDSFTIKQKFKKLHVGSMRHPEIEPTGLEFPTLTFYCGLGRAQGFLDWHEQYVVKGRRDTKMEKNGEIQYRSPSGDILMTISLRGVGITAVSIEKSEANADKLKLAKIECFVETMEIYDGMGLE